MNRAGNSLRRPFIRAGRRARFTLVEAMVACLILMLMALAGAAVLYQTLNQLGVQQARRQALAVANTRLEEVRATAYGLLTPPATNSLVYYLHHTHDASGNWTYGTDNWVRPLPAADPGETVSIRGVRRPMVTAITYVDVDGGTTSYDGLRVAVTVRYGPGANDIVRLETLRSP